MQREQVRGGDGQQQDGDVEGMVSEGVVFPEQVVQREREEREGAEVEGPVGDDGTPEGVGIQPGHFDVGILENVPDVVEYEGSVAGRQVHDDARDREKDEEGDAPDTPRGLHALCGRGVGFQRGRLLRHAGHPRLAPRAAPGEAIPLERAAGEHPQAPQVPHLSELPEQDARPAVEPAVEFRLLLEQQFAGEASRHEDRAPVVQGGPVVLPVLAVLPGFLVGLRAGDRGVDGDDDVAQGQGEREGDRLVDGLARVDVVPDHEEAGRPDPERGAPPRDVADLLERNTLLDEVQHPLVAALDADADLPAPVVLHELQRLEVQVVDPRHAGPGERDPLAAQDPEDLAEPGLVQHEGVVQERDLAHPEVPDQGADLGGDVAGGEKAHFSPEGVVVAEDALVRAAPARDDAGHGLFAEGADGGAVDRQVGAEVPGRGGRSSRRATAPSARFVRISPPSR